MEMSLLISVIVPIYKVERFLHKCVDSILCQTYVSFEIILVDDGSPDFCPQICDEYAAKDSRVIVVHKLNGGLSDARNTGVEKAKGDYVMFMDSDDFWVDEYQLERLVKEIENLSFCDFLGFNCFYYYTTKKEYIPWIPYTDDILNVTNRDDLINRLVQTGTFPMSACLKIIKRTFLFENRIQFIKGIVCEDIPWFIELLSCSQNFRVINQYMYAYRQGVEGSITKSFSTKSFLDLFNILRDEVDFIQNSSFSPQTKDSLLSFMAYEFCILLGYIGVTDRKSRVKNRKKLVCYKWLLNYTINPKVKKVSWCNRLLGIRVTEAILFTFMKFK